GHCGRVALAEIEPEEEKTPTGHGSEQRFLAGQASVLTGPRPLPQGHRDIARDRSLRSRCNDRLLDALDVDERAAAVAASWPLEWDQRVHAVSANELAVAERNQRRGASHGHAIVNRRTGLPRRCLLGAGRERDAELGRVPGRHATNEVADALKPARAQQAGGDRRAVPARAVGDQLALARQLVEVST